MDVTPEALAKLKHIADVLHARNAAKLAGALQNERAVADQIAQAKKRRAVSLPGGSDDPSLDMIAARVWSASADPVAKALTRDLQIIRDSLLSAKAETRVSLGKTLACKDIAADVTKQQKRKDARIEERQYQRDGDHNAPNGFGDLKFGLKIAD